MSVNERGQPIASIEMREWLDDSVSELLAHRPSRVHEIGCGSGMVLFRVAPETTEACSSSPRETRRPFDLTTGPLVRATLMKCGDEDFVLQIAMHHIVSDGWSLGVFIRELSALQMGLAPDVLCSQDMTPVDYVAQAIVGLAFRSGPQAGTFHLVSADRFHWPERVRSLSGLGHALRIVPADEWLAVLQKALGSSEASALEAS